MQRILIALLVTLVVTIAGAPAHAASTTDQRLADSQRVFESFANLSEEAIPTYLLERAYGVVVFPQVIRAALFLGGRGGNGVMSVRNPDGTWSNPVFVTMGGANFGFQWGVQSTELVLVLMSRKSVEGISGGKVTLGADASVAAGPVGRSATAATDATFKAQVLGYARNSGLFAGVALDGSVISIDDDANAIAYGVPDILPSQILEGRVANPPPAAREFSAALARATAAASAPAAKQPAAAKTPAGEPKPAPAPADSPATDAAKTFPMEDPAPGAPPPQ
jgi:lipid-binding SYLF domain-containing protein